MPTGVELQIQKQMDNLAAWRKALVAAVSGRTLLWTLVDAAQNIPYENRVKGSSITEVDTTLDTIAVGDKLSTWFSLHNDYFRLDAALTDFAGALAIWKWRVHEYFDDLYFEVIGNHLTKAYVFPRDDMTLATYARTSSVFTDVAAIDSTYTNGGKIGAKATSTIGAANWDVTATLVRIDDTTIALAIQFLAAATLNTVKTFGQITVGSDAAAGQAIVLIATTTPFKVGEPVLISDAADQEYGVVLSINSGVSVTLSANLRNTYEVADNAVITAMFKDCTVVTHTNGTNGDTASIVVVPDRAVSLV